MMSPKQLMAILLCQTVSGCSTYAMGDVKPLAQVGNGARSATNSANIAITEGDLTRPYETLGDVDVTVNKMTIVNHDPTRENVNAALRERAATLGADAIIFARYGTVGISPLSWGSLEGKGRAVAFEN